MFLSPLSLVPKLLAGPALRFTVKPAFHKAVSSVRLNSSSAAIRVEDVATENDVTEDAASPVDVFAPTESVRESKLHNSLSKAFESSIGPTFTPVQQRCINEFDDSENGIIVRAKTGTGKTFAFGLPVMHDHLTNKSRRTYDYESSVNSVIFCPTRDLVTQNEAALQKLWRNASRSRSNDIVNVMGQTSIRTSLSPFLNRSHKPFIVVATPGRFLDFIQNQPKFRQSFRYLKHIIIDEADELLNQNFKDDLIEIIETLKSVREPIPGDDSPNQTPKTMLFSATINDDVMELAETAFGHKDLPFIDITGSADKEVNENIKQSLIKTDTYFDTYAASMKFIHDESISNPHFKAMVFVSHTQGVEVYNRLLRSIMREGGNRNVWKLHGKLPQGARNQAQERFRKAHNGVLVASNVAARGLDFPDVTHVIQIGVNHEIAGHTHRVGRTGRAGKKGESLLYLANCEGGYVKSLEKAGNVFQEVQEYQPDTEFKVLLQEHSSRFEELDEFFTSILNATFSVPKEVVKIQKIEVLKQSSKFYQDLADKYDELPFVSKNTAMRSGFDTEEARQYVSIPGKPSKSSSSSGFERRSNNRSGKRDFNGSGFSSRRGGYNDNGNVYNDKRYKDRNGSQNRSSFNTRRGSFDRKSSRADRWKSAEEDW